MCEETTTRLTAAQMAVHSGVKNSSPCTKELYSAFGEKGDEGDEEPGENTGLPVGSLSMGVEVGFHKGFYDDGDPNTPRTAPAPAYCDEPRRVGCRRVRALLAPVAAVAAGMGAGR